MNLLGKDKNDKVRVSKFRKVIYKIHDSFEKDFDKVNKH